MAAVNACGICGTDVHILEGHYGSGYPLIPGHEFAGHIVEVGREVRHLSVGMKVAVDPSLYCNQCRYCRRGRNNLCDELRGMVSSM